MNKHQNEISKVAKSLVNAFLLLLHLATSLTVIGGGSLLLGKIITEIDNRTAVHAAEPAKSTETKPSPKYLVTLYSGGKIVEVGESNQVQFSQDTPRVWFKDMNGNRVDIILNGPVIREIAIDDVWLLQQEREKNSQLRQVLAIKRQEMLLKKELAERQQLLNELQKIDRQPVLTNSVTKSPVAKPAEDKKTPPVEKKK